MIISRTPFRVSFAGGGTDLAGYYKNQDFGCVISATINKYMYISIHPYFDLNKISLKYSKNEVVGDINNIKHPIFREALRLTGILKGVDLTSIADVPAGTGLGSSSSFTVGLLHALNAYKGKFSSAELLAKDACKIEIDILKEPIGKQDQYAAAFGSLNYIQFNADGSVLVKPIINSKKIIKELEDNLLMFYAGTSRNANEILNEQKENIPKKLENLNKMRDLVKELWEALNSGDLSTFGEILHKGWLFKRELASKITNPIIDKYYNIAIKNGALGGKLVGAGSSGFLLFYCEKEKQEKLRSQLQLNELKFNFDVEGSKIIYVSD